MRTIAYCGEGGTVSYSVVGPGGRHCDNVGRTHRSNFVYFVLDFASGLFCHKCHDPECAGFRSPWLPLPQEVWCQEDILPLLQARGGGGGGGGWGAQ